MSTATPTATGTVKRFWALDAPVLTMHTSILVLGGEGTLECPFPSFLIEHEQGLVLIDTGLRPEAAEDPVGTYGALGEALFPNGFPRELAIDRQLEKLGYSPGDIGTVVMSHLHFDHTGAMRLFEHADFIGGRGEMQFAWWPDPANMQAGFFATEDFAFLRERPGQWFEVGPEDHDLFGDGSVVLYHLPGHTPGSLGILVRTPEQNIVLATDIVHVRAGLTGIPMPYDWSATETAKSVMRLKAIAKAHDAQLWIGHDPEDWAQMKHAPAVYDGSSV